MTALKQKRAPPVSSPAIGGEFPLTAKEGKLWLSDAVDASAADSFCRAYGEAESVWWFAFGRSALAAALDICGMRFGDGVGVPSYQCAAVVRKLATRASPVPYRLDDHWSPRAEDIKASAKRCRALITCAYFDSAALQQRLSEQGRNLMRWPDRPWIIEDRVMCFPSPVNRARLSERCDFAVYSFRKHYPVPDGALLLACSDRARETLRKARKPSMNSLAAKEHLAALRTKVNAKIKRHHWHATGRQDDPAVNGLPESIESEAAIERVASSTAADYLPGSPASAAFLSHQDLPKDAKSLALRLGKLTGSLRDLDVNGMSLPLPDSRAIGIPVLLSHRDRLRAALRRRRVFLPVHWPSPEGFFLTPEARRWHQEELTVTAPAYLPDGGIDYLIDVFREAAEGL